MTLILAAYHTLPNNILMLWLSYTVVMIKEVCLPYTDKGKSSEYISLIDMKF